MKLNRNSVTFVNILHHILLSGYICSEKAILNRKIVRKHIPKKGFRIRPHPQNNHTFQSKMEVTLKVSGPFVETPRIFLCMQNINYAEILA